MEVSRRLSDVLKENKRDQNAGQGQQGSALSFWETHGLPKTFKSGGVGMKFLETNTDLFVPDACALSYDPDSSMSGQLFCPCQGTLV